MKNTCEISKFQTFLIWQGKSQGILALQGFITACDWQGTRQAQVPCCTIPNPNFAKDDINQENHLIKSNLPKRLCDSSLKAVCEETYALLFDQIFTQPEISFVNGFNFEYVF